MRARRTLEGLFVGLDAPLRATRYHSLVVDERSMPAELVPCAWADDALGTSLMALRHEVLPLHGVQFHPESVGTPDGKRLLRNFLATS